MPKGLIQRSPTIRVNKMLNDDIRNKLIEAATIARKKAYAPYSGYLVGAALLTESDDIFTGVNVENAAYPSSMCAERAAIFNAIGEGEKQFKAIAVVTSNGGSPCGACRQVLAEFGTGTIVLLADDQGQMIEETTLEKLLPGAFGPGDLPDTKK